MLAHLQAAFMSAGTSRARLAGGGGAGMSAPVAVTTAGK